MLLHLPHSRDGACEHAATVLLYAMDHYGEMAGLASLGALTTAKLVRQAGAKYVQGFLARELAGNAELAGGSRAASGCRRRPGLTAASGEGAVRRRRRDRGILARLLRRQLRRARRRNGDGRRACRGGAGVRADRRADRRLRGLGIRIRRLRCNHGCGQGRARQVPCRGEEEKGGRGRMAPRSRVGWAGRAGRPPPPAAAALGRDQGAKEGGAIPADQGGRRRRAHAKSLKNVRAAAPA